MVWSHKFPTYHKLLAYRIAIINFKRLRINRLSKYVTRTHQQQQQQQQQQRCSLIFSTWILSVIDYIRCISILNSSKDDILKVKVQLSAWKSYVNCELSILRNQIESFTERTKMSLGYENRNIYALHKSLAFLQNKLT